MKYTHFRDESSFLKQAANAAFEMKYTNFLDESSFLKKLQMPPLKWNTLTSKMKAVSSNKL